MFKKKGKPNLKQQTILLHQLLTLKKEERNRPNRSKNKQRREEKEERKKLGLKSGSGASIQIVEQSLLIVVLLLKLYLPAKDKSYSSKKWLQILKIEILLMSQAESYTNLYPNHAFLESTQTTSKKYLNSNLFYKINNNQVVLKVWLSLMSSMSMRDYLISVIQFHPKILKDLQRRLRSKTIIKYHAQ